MNTFSKITTFQFSMAYVLTYCQYKQNHHYIKVLTVCFYQFSGKYLVQLHRSCLRLLVFDQRNDVLPGSPAGNCAVLEVRCLSVETRRSKTLYFNIYSFLRANHILVTKSVRLSINISMCNLFVSEVHDFVTFFIYS